MKLAKYINLERQDDIFHGSENEPEKRYKRRQIVVVEDSFDFTDPNVEDVSSITNWILFWTRAGSKAKAVDYMQSTISDWSAHDSKEKELFLDFIAHSGKVCCVSSDQKTDLEPLINIGFTVFENGLVNDIKSWDGIGWK